MAAVVQGVMQGNLPWIPVISGIMLAASIELLGISSLPFAIGLYLPFDLSSPIMLGGVLALIIQKRYKDDSFKHKNESGIMFASGLVAGDALTGVLVAGLVAAFAGYRSFYEAHENVGLAGAHGPWLSLFCFALLMIFFWRRIRKS